MKESNNSRRIVGKFAARFIILGVIFGAIALVLETWVPEYANWGLDSRRVIFSSVVSIIATLCTAYFAVSSSISGVIFKSQEEAEINIQNNNADVVLFDCNVKNIDIIDRRNMRVYRSNDINESIKVILKDLDKPKNIV